MNTEMLWEEWVEKYKPIHNHLDKNADESQITFETYGKEYEYVLEIHEIDPRRIWTLVDGDTGTFVLDGWHYVNRLNYFVTERPFDGPEGSFCMLDGEYSRTYAKLTYLSTGGHDENRYGLLTYFDAEGTEPMDEQWFFSDAERAEALEGEDFVVISCEAVNA